MTSTTFFIIFIPVLAIILLAVNLIFAPHNPYQEKDTPFECGFTSFSGQNRTQFSISFFIFALLFLLFDLEIVLIYPYSVSGYNNGIYGLSVMIVFFLVLTGGFVFELGKNALTIDSRQTSTYENEDIPESHVFIEESLDNYESPLFLEWSLSNPPKPHAFTNSPLHSELSLPEIISEINWLLPQLSNFINQFNMTVIESNINVVTDSSGNLSIDVLSSMPHAEANKISTKINIIDRLISTKQESIQSLLQKGTDLEKKIMTENPKYVSQLTDKMKEFNRIKDSYKH